MIYLVMIRNNAGTQALKKYECASLSEAIEAAEIDIWDYPDCRVSSVVPVYERAVAKAEQHRAHA